jgi:aminomethyltransferase
MNQKNTIFTTPLHNLHVELGGKMMPFAGYDMPVQFPGGIIKEHQHTRSHAGLFDVSHMGQLIVSGPDVTRELERLVPVDLEALAVNQQTYAVFTNTEGGIKDDLIITRFADDKFFLVVNAACKANDTAHLREQLSDDIKIETLASHALLALQGPTASNVMAELAPSTTELVFMRGCTATISGVECYVTRSGYTGEDGFEISVPGAEADAIARRLLNYADVEPIGLGARDSLRLEAGLCLYGHDMDDNTSPVEATLLFSISKSRRPGGTKAGGFIGADSVFGHIENGVTRKRRGLLVQGRIPVREGAELVDTEGQVVGTVTSGGFGPTLQSPIALGYVASRSADFGTELFALVRGKQVPITVAKTPFISQRYFRG